MPRTAGTRCHSWDGVGFYFRPTDLQVVELVDQEAQRQAQHARHRHHRRLRRTREHHRKQYERLCVPAVADEPRG